jgi:predicted Zn-dependent protease
MRLLPIFAICLPLLAHAHGDAHDRLKALDQQIQQHPGNADLHLKRGRIYLEENHLTEARSDLERVLALDPSKLGAHYFLAEALFNSEHHDLAEKHLQQFIRQNEGHNLVAQSRGYWLMGQTRMARHQVETAIVAYKMAMTAKPDLTPDQYKLFVDACLAARGPYLEEALRLLDARQSHSGSPDWIQDMAIEVELKAGRRDAALARLDALISSQKRLPFLYAKKASLQLDAGHSLEAEKSLRLARSAFATLNEKRQRSKVYVELNQQIEALAERLTHQQKK